MPGAIAENFHEGSRSEYLAQYVFSSLGSAAAVPHQEDYGLDLNCTLTERLGQRAYVKDYFTVQVKSNSEPWVFDTPESVGWLVEHPLPLFLCVVDKSTARLAVYQTLPRYLVWSLPPLPDRLELIPSQDKTGRCPQWGNGETFSLSAPILEFGMSDLLQDNFRDQARNVLEFWISFEKKNLLRVKTGVREFIAPDGYRTNDTSFTGYTTQSIRIADSQILEDARAYLVDYLGWYSEQLFESGDIGGAVRGLLMLRHIDYENVPSRLARVGQHLNDQLHKSGYIYAGLDEINSVIDAALSV